MACSKIVIKYLETLLPRLESLCKERADVSKKHLQFVNLKPELSSLPYNE
jgi:hypothetical protein